MDWTEIKQDGKSWTIGGNLQIDGGFPSITFGK